MEMMWFIETWSPSDGIAFASRRLASKPTENWNMFDDQGRVHTLALALEGPIDRDDDGPSLTVVLHPPYWDPLAVSNPATAWRALAHGYQHRLYDQEGEIAFRTLDEVKEVVRRGYTGGGLGFTPGPAPGPEPAPREGGPELASPQFSDEMRGEERMNWPVIREALATIETSRNDAYDRLLSYVRNNDGRIIDYHRYVAREYLPWFSTMVSHDERAVPWRDAVTWFCGVEPMDDFYRYARMHLPFIDESQRDFLESLYYGPRWSFRYDESARAILNGMLFRIPLLISLPRIETFGDLLVAASTSRAFVRRLEIRHLFLLLFIATLVVRANGGVPWWRNDWRTLSAASRWLVDAMPAILPPTHRAEALLDRLVE